MGAAVSRAREGRDRGVRVPEGALQGMAVSQAAKVPCSDRTALPKLTPLALLPHPCPEGNLEGI
ncbi:hypothetical protein GCM10009754_80840 [Amycolatopsis minnesotensis]|uniref:Uncharacterized protein n=1 Tax=Amycolatopsis minnesotensis TaxID=337894 RepID=A0ABP5E3I3_9PSEU